MNIVNGAKAHIARVAVVLAAAALAVSLAQPLCAHALETERWSAQPNDADGSQVLGATPTRVTWQGQTAEDESLSQVVIDLPEGSTVEAENVKVTVMNGLDRLDVAAQATVDGVRVTASFSDPAPAGSLVMLECNRVLLPGGGGSFGLAGSYTTADGQQHDMPATDKTFTVVSTSPADQLSSWLGQQEWVKAWNSNKFLHLFFDPSIIVTSVPVVFSGWLIAIALVIVKLSGWPLPHRPSVVVHAHGEKPCPARSRRYVHQHRARYAAVSADIHRDFFGLPLLGIKMDLFVLGAIVLVLNSSAYLAEIFRAGIQSINGGQFEAARSLGMNGAQTMFYVIIPQTVRRVIPTMTSEFILMYKDTSLLAAVGVMEIMMYAKTITAATGNVTPYIVAAGFYLIVTIPMTKLINSMEQRMAGGRKKRKKGVTITSEEAVLPDSDAAVSKSLRMSETLAGSNHISH